MAPPNEHEKRFARYLAGLAADDDRAALAALRRGLSQPPGAAVETHRYVVPRLPADAQRWQEDNYYLVAALFALHPGNWEPTEESRSNLGASFARLKAKTEKAKTESESTEKRFAAMLNSPATDLFHHLRHAVALLKSKDISIDWAQLLHDLQSWSRDDRLVQREWARALWGARVVEQPDADAAPAQTNS
jgi:CRISPR system Cascade subunit CasB